MDTKKRGFTLIEFLVIIAIVGLLSAIILVSVQEARAKAKDAAIKTALVGLRNQAEMDYDANGNNYSAVCEETGGEEGDSTIDYQKIADNITNNGGNGACNESTSSDEWAAWSVLVYDPAKYWCVDSSGASGELTSAPGADSTNCGISSGDGGPIIPPDVNKGSPFGVHPADVNNGYGRALNIGVKWHRPSIYMFWFIVQKDLNNPDLDFSFYDNYYGRVPNNISIMANIAPDTKRSSHGYYINSGSFMPVDENKYKRFVKLVVERYDGDGIDDMPNLKNPILYWQVGNEPDDRTIKDFAKLQKITYESIEEACSQCKVLVGGAAQPIDTLGLRTLGFVSKTDDYFYEFSKSYEPILKELSGEGFDIFDFHWYGEADGDYRKLGPVYEQIKILLKKYGFGGTPVWITEMGAYSGEPSDKSPKGEKLFSFQTETQQANDYLKRFIYPLSLGIKKIFPAFGLVEGFKNDDGYFDHTGFIYDGKGSNDLGLGVNKLSYYTYKKMTEILGGSDWNNIETIQESNGVYIYKFTKNNKPIWVAWNDNSGGKQITISGISLSQVKITEAVPKYESGKDVVSYSTAFNTGTKSVSQNKITLTLQDKPVFVEEK